MSVVSHRAAAVLWAVVGRARQSSNLISLSVKGFNKNLLPQVNVGKDSVCRSVSLSIRSAKRSFGSHVFAGRHFLPCGCEAETNAVYFLINSKPPAPCKFNPLPRHFLTSPFVNDIASC